MKSCLPVRRGGLGALVCVLLLGGSGEALAGLDISEVAPGFYRGSAPETSADYEVLQQYGIRTVLDLRKYNPEEVACTRRELAARGIRHINVRMGFFPLRDNSVEQALCIVANPSLRPIYLHCKLGQDRVGLVVGIYRVRYQGVRPAASYAEMESYGYHRVLVGLTRYYEFATARQFSPVRRRSPTPQSRPKSPPPLRKAGARAAPRRAGQGGRRLSRRLTIGGGKSRDKCSGRRWKSRTK